MGISRADHRRVVLPFINKTQGKRAPRILRSTLGFSLLEMIVVLVIVGIAAALLAPTVGNSLDKFKFKSIARQVSASLRNARSQAVANKVNFEVSFDPENNKYSIAPEQLEDDGASGREGGRREGSDGSGAQARAPKHQFLPKGISLRTESGRSQKIVFFPRGNSTGGRIEIERSGGDKLIITVDRITGRVKVAASKGS